MKRLTFAITVLALVIILVIAYRYFLPYGRLVNTSEFCRKSELYNNPLKCKLSGCIWGNGDLTGPPFCGAYKE